MVDLNLAELDRLAQVPGVWTHSQENSARAQLRPLLDLVDRMGTAFAPLICKSAPTEAEVNAAITALTDYQRAKGGSP